MKKPLLPLLAACALLAAPLASQALVYQFNAGLNSANEVGGDPPPMSAATGVATLFYDDMDTAKLEDDNYDFAMSVFGLTGGTVADTAASAFHIHAAGNTNENAPVRVSLDAAPFIFSNSGSTLLVGGNGVAATSIPATPATAVNQGYPAMSFLAALQGQLAYVNVHTALNGAGAVRGQLLQVAVIPEPSTYALLLAGLGLTAFVARRRKPR